VYLTHLGKIENADKTLVGKPERKRPRHRWEENIEMYPQ
jgi:hypothetical protein